MLITKVIAKKGQYEPSFYEFEYLELSWEEMCKRRLRTKTNLGREVDLAFAEGNSLQEGDLLAVEGKKALIVKLIPEKVLVIIPESPIQFGIIAYELGNRHLPAWLALNEIVVCADSVLQSYLIQHQIAFAEQERVLDNTKLIAVGGGISQHHHQQQETVG
jgi:urease accessory protein